MSQSANVGAQQRGDIAQRSHRCGIIRAMPASTASDLATFALAKIQPPHPRTDLIERPVLEQALGMALLRSRLTTLVAPAGYGKTAALTRQLRQLPEDCAWAWVSADEDDHLPRFIACLSAALECYDLPWRVSPDALSTLTQGPSGLRAAATELVNALASAEAPRGVIVVDDAHRIADPKVFELLQWMLEWLPAHWSLVIASRIEPPLPLARWRAAGELSEFRQRELSFSEDDVAALLVHAATGAHDAPTVAQLMERTNGWPAGLRLTLAARADTGMAAGRSAALPQRHMFDYLATEVLDGMPKVLRDFLLSCSVLPELTAPRCAQVSGRDDAPALLEEIERRGLFVSVLEADEPTLRLHDLFRDFLEHRLQRERPTELPLLLERAAAFEPDAARAIGHLARAGAWPAATQALLDRGPMLLAAGGVGLDDMLTMLPAEAFDSSPDLHLLKGLSLLMNFRLDAALIALHRASTGFVQAGRPREATASRAYASLTQVSLGMLPAAEAELALLRADELDPSSRALVCYGCIWVAYAHGRGEDAAPLYAEMLEALEKVPVLRAWNQVFFQSRLTGFPGLAPLMERFARSALAITSDTPSRLRAGVYYTRAVTALGAGRIDDASDCLQSADEDCRWLGSPRSVLIESRSVHVLVQALRGDSAASRAMADAAVADMRLNEMLNYRLTHGFETGFTILRAAWVLGEEASIRAANADLQAGVNPAEYPTALDVRRFGQAMIAVLDGHLALAASLLEPLAGEVEWTAYFPATQALVTLADVQVQSGQLDAAAVTLRPWLAAAQRGERLGGALLAGPRAIARLARTDWGSRLTRPEVETLRLLQGIGVAARGEGECTLPLSQQLSLQPAARREDLSGLAGLSQRELEVLRCIAAGDSNKLIARAFDLSPHTVKRHVANILNKLAVNTRGQAAARWRHIDPGTDSRY
ncbi:LuxR family maltose regulon positive regulatory protein [Acidovorax delafieldii]|uniref:helix-turn-helix transcriptional regulator n=1 Tax=Acidovorax delafieldii TaxID=47920 RepID=UPI00285E97C0|nr:LuxR C-terminal-related transcriptional regulator [Acidovorax delafieldii]MDR6154148.1 LuxR family maltose regulon positive regulatory protein [Acidovorax delafieldii]